MKRAWIPLLVAAPWLVAACGGLPASNSPLTSSPGVSATEATLGLTPIVESTTPSTLDTLPDLSENSLPATDSTDVPVPLDSSGLPAPAPPPLPDAHENQVQLGTIEIPALKVSQNFFEGVTLTTLNYGPGHWPGSALPGQVGNLVIAGHRTSHTHPFRDLDLLKKGDQLIVTTAQGRNVYVVDRTQIVTPEALWIVNQTREKTATMFACHPKGSTSHRIVVFLKYAPELSQPTG